MLLRRLISLAACAALFGFAGAGMHELAAQDQDGIDFFEKRIRPVLVAHCYKCHSRQTDEVQGGLFLDSASGIRQGGESGAAILPHRPAESPLIRAIRYEDLEMPPNRKLPDRVISHFVEWVRTGAPLPQDIDGRWHDAAANGGATESLRRQRMQHWSFQPVAPSAIPSVNRTSWSRSAIDRFILSKLEQKGLTPTADADPRTLLRRTYFALIGLPPTFEQVEAFVSAFPAADSPSTASSDNSFDKVVERLLASPQFGERWGRHWLDVVRYAESNGGDFNRVFPYAWRYRDYVIAAFNADKPFDQFIREQIAGDLLPAAGPTDRDENLIATGMLAIGKKAINGVRSEEFRMNLADDQIDVTTRTFLALTVSCARCHDHKFDPVSTEDYYALAGIFTSCDTRFGSASTVGPLPRFLGLGPDGQARLKVLKPLANKGNQLAKQVEVARKALSRARRVLEQLEELDSRPADKLQQAQSAVDDAQSAFFRLSAELSEVEAQLAKHPPLAMGLLEKLPADCQICIRGDASNRGPAVPRGTLRIGGHGAPVPPDQSGRLQLADWVASTDNPLAARVIVNRVWQHLFGHGLVRSVDNFGLTGDQPSHPALLDYLAATLVRDGWSIKRLVRRIVLSRVFRLGSQYADAAFQADPDNRLLWRMPRRRLQFEELRDTLLSVSGELDRAPLRGSLAHEWGEERINTRYDRTAEFLARIADDPHRAVYQPVLRDMLSEMASLFDHPDPSLVKGRRDSTNVPTQVLFLLNNRFVLDRARATARRIRLDPDDAHADRIDQAFQIILQRSPSETERSHARLTLQRLSETTSSAAAEAERQLQIWASFCQALYLTADFQYLD